jgi:hypothetical protein
MWNALDGNMIAADEYYAGPCDEDMAQDILDGMSDEEILDIASDLGINVEDGKGGYTSDGLEAIFEYIVQNIDLYTQEEE